MEERDDEVSLKEIIIKAKEITSFLYTKKWILGAMSMLSGVIGFVYAHFQEPTYKATLTFALAEGDGSSGGVGALASQFGFDLGTSGSGAFTGDNVLELMKSRTLFEKTMLSTLDSGKTPKTLIERYLETHTKQTPTKANEPPAVQFSGPNTNTLNLYQDSFISVLHKTITKDVLVVQKIDKKLSIIKVEATDTDPVFAKELVEKLSENVTKFYIETKNRQSKKTIEKLERKVDSVRFELGKNMVGLASQVDNNELIVKKAPRVSEAKRQVEIQLLTIMYGELVKNLETTKTLLSKDQPLVEVIDTPKYPLDRKKKSRIVSAIVGFFIGLFMSTIITILIRAYKNIMD